MSTVTRCDGCGVVLRDDGGGRYFGTKLEMSALGGAAGFRWDFCVPCRQYATDLLNGMSKPLVPASGYLVRTPGPGRG